MSERLEREIRDWLKAERLSDDEMAEAALARAFAELGRRLPQPGLADRVMVSAGRLTPVPALWRSRWLGALVLTSIATVGLAVVLLPVLWLVAEPVARALGAPFVVAASHAVARGLARALAVWDVFADLVSALRAALVTRPALVLLFASGLVATTSLLGLKRLLTAPEESMS